MGYSWLEILEDSLTRKLLGHDQAFEEDALPFLQGVATRLDFLLRDPTKHLAFLKIGYSALECFLQSNCTGPPLDFDPEPVVIPRLYAKADGSLALLKKDLFTGLSVDGDAVYALTPHIELFWLAKVCMGNRVTAEAGFNGRRARYRVTFVHQKLLLEKSDTLRDQIYADADVLEHQLASRLAFHGAAAEEHFVEFLVERAAMRTYYGDDAKAREDLVRASQIRKFQFALTGILGKRTKFQDRDISQLVVLAKSRDHEPEPYSSRRSSRAEGTDSRTGSRSDSITNSEQATSSPKSPPNAAQRPENILLNDDTLLETLQFKQHPINEAQLATVEAKESLPDRLRLLDPAEQPLLNPMDSIILLQTASSISNASPTDGLTREETLPYAVRVLEGGSSNWQVYTQALLVRSRIEGYRSRTMERGLLQLQALTDQVIAETTSSAKPTRDSDEAIQGDPSQITSFLPKAKPSESASVAERLKYIYQISPPLRWELEAELAARWVHMGGLKTALEIYSRLEMQAEVALCLAGTDQEGEAIRTIRKLLFSVVDTTSEQQSYTNPEISPLPSDAARLYCILGDLENDPAHYQRAWTASSNRYARAQRSLGRYYVKNKEYAQAVEAYSQSLHINRLNASTWFALGCVHLEVSDWPSAVNSFTRAVQLQDDDAEAWSNLAVALLRLPEPDATNTDGLSADHAAGTVTVIPTTDSHLWKSTDELTLSESPTQEDDLTISQPKQYDPYKNTRDALTALRRAAQIKRDNARIWDNYLTVAASIPPPGTPWTEILNAQRRVIELRGKTIGEKAIDVSILTVLVEHVIHTYEYPQYEDEAEHEDESTTTGNGNDNGEGSGAGVDDVDNPPQQAQTPQPQRQRWTGLPKYTCLLIDQAVIPLITSSAPIWLLIAKLQLWRHRPLASLDAHEKAWRVVTSQPGVYERDEKSWEEVVDGTCRLVEAYQELGGMERERSGGRVVEGDWRFKGRTAVRGVLGKGKVWEGSEGWRRLDDLLKGLKDGMWAYEGGYLKNSK
jgi:tetratricopeptide (TPR) repeat protein